VPFGSVHSRRQYFGQFPNDQFEMKERPSSEIIAPESIPYIRISFWPVFDDYTVFHPQALHQPPPKKGKKKSIWRIGWWRTNQSVRLRMSPEKPSARHYFSHSFKCRLNNQPTGQSKWSRDESFFSYDIQGAIVNEIFWWKLALFIFFLSLIILNWKRKKLEKSLCVVCYLVAATRNKTSYILSTLSNLFIFWVDAAAAPGSIQHLAPYYSINFGMMMSAKGARECLGSFRSFPHSVFIFPPLVNFQIYFCYLVLGSLQQMEWLCLLIPFSRPSLSSIRFLSLKLFSLFW
jgi:hypothetical protein